jgi:hypothetical protein
MKSLLIQGPINVPKNAAPLYIEVPVDALTAPYLVTSTRAVMWIDEALNGRMVRAAVRRGVKKPGALYAEIVEAIAKRGAEWDSVHPLTKEGILKAIEHVRYYGFDEVEVLVPTEDEKPLVEVDDKTRVDVADWLPDKTVVVVPVNREFVGILGRVSPSAVLAVVHNPSRGVAIAKGG